MKKFLVLCFFVAAAAASSSANTVTLTCTTSGGNGASGTATSVCNSSASIDYTTLDSVVLTSKFDADFGLGAGSVLESFDVAPDGTADAFGGALDHPSNQQVTDTARGIVETFTILNPTVAEVDAALAGLTVDDTWSSGTGSFFNAAFSYQVAVNYTPGGASTGGGDGNGNGGDGGGTPMPESGTLSMLLVGLVGLGLFARRRPQTHICRS